MDLSKLRVGETAKIVSVEADPALRARLAALNVAEGKKVSALRTAPFGGGIMLDADGVRLALRVSLAKRIGIGLISEEEK